MTATLRHSRPLAAPTDDNNPRRAKQQARAPRLALWGLFEGTSVVLQFAGFMIVLLAQGLSKIGTRALGKDPR